MCACARVDICVCVCVCVSSGTSLLLFMCNDTIEGRVGDVTLLVDIFNVSVVALVTSARGGQTGCEGTEWELETSVRCVKCHNK